MEKNDPLIYTGFLGIAVISAIGGDWGYSVAITLLVIALFYDREYTSASGGGPDR